MYSFVGASICNILVLSGGALMSLDRKMAFMTEDDQQPHSHPRVDLKNEGLTTVLSAPDLYMYATEHLVKCTHFSRHHNDCASRRLILSE